MTPETVALFNLIYLASAFITCVCTYPAGEEQTGRQTRPTFFYYSPEERFGATCLFMAVVGGILAMVSFYELHVATGISVLDMIRNGLP